MVVGHGVTPRPRRRRGARWRCRRRGVAAATSAEMSANRNPPSGGVVDHRAMPCFVMMPLMKVSSPVLPGAARSWSTMRARAWKVALLSGPPPNVIPPPTVSGRESGRSTGRPSSWAWMRTATGKQLYRSTRSADATSIPDSSDNRSAPRGPPARGEAPRAARSAPCRSIRPPPAGRPDGRAATPARSAAPLEHNTNAAAWSTFHCEQCHFVYGAASIGLASDGCSRNSGVTAFRRHASGFCAATRLNADHSSPVARAFSLTDSPRAARSAVRAGSIAAAH